MALTFTDVTLDTRTVSAIEVTTDQWIQEDALSAFDKVHLEAAMAETALSDYAMPNTGTTADVYFAPFMKTAEQLTESFARNRIRQFPNVSIRNNEKALSALEAGEEETP